MMIDKLNNMILDGEGIKDEYADIQSKNNVRGVHDFSQDAPPSVHEWMSDVKLFASRHLRHHPLSHDLSTALFFGTSKISDIDRILGILKTISKDERSLSEGTSTLGHTAQIERGPYMVSNNKVFIVHGHDDGAKQTVARYIEALRLEAIILHEQASGGQAIIEKIETYSDVGYAVVLYTPCDTGKAQSDEEYSFRARQNVVFEHGYLIGHLGRDKVCALVKGTLEMPGDTSGVIYINMDDAGAWKNSVFKEMKSAGYNLDANTIF